MLCVFVFTIWIVVQNSAAISVQKKYMKTLVTYSKEGISAPN